MSPRTPILRALAGAVLLGLLASIAGCASPSKLPVYANALFNPAEVDLITILPIVDLRQGEKVGLDVNAIVSDRTKSMLEKKNYRVSLGGAPDSLASLTQEDLNAEDVEWVRRLTPSGSRWVMVIAVHDVASKLTFGSTGNAEVSGYFYDTRDVTKLWHDNGIGQVGQGGLLGMLEVGLMSRQALNEAIFDCVLSFPSRPKSD